MRLLTHCMEGRNDAEGGREVIAITHSRHPRLHGNDRESERGDVRGGLEQPASWPLQYISFNQTKGPAVPRALGQIAAVRAVSRS